MTLRLALLASCLFAVSCASGEDVDDDLEADDGLLDGKNDGAGLTEGEPRALGVLRVANTASADELRAGRISSQARQKIVAGRPIGTIAALDALAGVGPTTLARLETMATARGWTEPAFYQHDLGLRAPYAAYNLIERADGTLSSLSWTGTTWHFQRDLGTPLLRTVELGGDQLRVLGDRTVWREARLTGVLYGLTVSDNGAGVLHAVLLRLDPNTLPATGVAPSPLERVWSGTVSTRDVALTVGDSGDVTMVYARGRALAADSGLHQTRCAPAQACVTSLVLAAPDVAYRPFALAQHGDERVVAVRLSDTPAAVKVLSSIADGPWTEVDLTAPSTYATQLQLHAGAGGWRLTLHDPRTGMSVLAREASGNWRHVGTLPRLALPGSTEPRPDLALGATLAVAAGNRVFLEGDGFPGRDLAPAVSTRVLRTGQVALAGRTLVRTRGDALPFRDASRGAGTLEFGRDPCFWGGSNRPAVPVTRTSAGKLRLAVTGSLTVPAGACVVADEIVGDGELVLAGTEDRPVVVRGATIDQRLRVRARWTFFLGTVDRLIDGGLASGRAFGAPGLDLDHVSMSASRAVDTSAVAAEDYRRTSFAAPRHVAIVRHSLFAGGGGDLLDLGASVDLLVEDSAFVDLAGTAIRVSNGGLDDTRVRLRNVSFDRVGAALSVRAMSAARRAEVAVYGQGLSAAARDQLRRQPLTPVELTGLTITTTTGATEARPAVLLQAPTGTVSALRIDSAIADGLVVEEAGPLEILDSALVNNDRHGLVVRATNPAGLGPCYVPSQSPIEQPLVRVVYYPPDPVVTGCEVAGNGGAGIWVGGPHIPMQITASDLRDNALEALVIEPGRGPSAWGLDPTCPSGWRLAADDVALPLSPDTVVTGNNVVGNGAAAEGRQVRSAHELGAVPMTDNYWGTSDTAEASRGVRCTGACAITPIRPTPHP
jgi:hypothetical protein